MIAREPVARRFAMTSRALHELNDEDATTHSKLSQTGAGPHWHFQLRHGVAA